VGSLPMLVAPTHLPACQHRQCGQFLPCLVLTVPAPTHTATPPQGTKTYTLTAVNDVVQLLGQSEQPAFAASVAAVE
jgi:hypothetical protein